MSVTLTLEAFRLSPMRGSEASGIFKKSTLLTDTRPTVVGKEVLVWTSCKSIDRSFFPIFPITPHSQDRLRTIDAWTGWCI